MEYLGWIGSICLAICALPQVIHTAQTKETQGLSKLFLLLWLVGEIAAIIYQHLKNGFTPLHFNYIFNIVLISILCYYKGKE